MPERDRIRKQLVAMFGLGVVVIALLTLGLVLGLDNHTSNNGSGNNMYLNGNRSFTIDHKANTFLLDGQPFRYISGSFHYFRALPKAWQSRLRTMRAAGLNALDTYVEWSLHNPYDGVYNWEGIADVVNFIKLAQQEGFLVILRPGPYICAERDNGGFPHWLFSKYPGIKLRTRDVNYLAEISKWYGELMSRLQPYFYGNGGPIIMVQVENEYAAFDACDHFYLNWLRDETQKYTQNNALLFTVDMPNERMACGKIENVFATTDFGIDRIHEIVDIWKILRQVQPTGPLVNSEFYPGWLTHWQEKNQRRDGKVVANALRTILEDNANVNIYMFFGGTNFGFTAGANDWGAGNYTADITSYDYDAVIDEAGNVTPKFELIRNVIKDFLPLPDITLNPVKPLAYGQVKLQPILELLSVDGRALLANGKAVEAKQTKTFEELDQHSGLVLYETTLPNLEIDPTLLTVDGLRDRAFVFVDQQYVGTLARENNIFVLPLQKGWGTRLQLLVENQGRINYNLLNDTKGIFGAITVQKLNGEKQALTDWSSTSFPLEEKQINALLAQHKQGALGDLSDSIAAQTVLRTGPLVYYGEFNAKELGDTYLNVRGWGKGVAYLNGFNLGRYWPLAGPQLTLYVPNEALRLGINTLALLEYQRANTMSDDKQWSIVELEDIAQLDNNGGEN